MSKVTSQVDEAKSGLDAISNAARDVTERAREVANNAADSSLNFAKRYPVHTALGALGVGCIVGFLARKPK